MELNADAHNVCSSFLTSYPFRVGDMDWPLSNWRYGLAPFQLGIWTGPFPVAGMAQSLELGMQTQTMMASCGSSHRFI